MVITQAQPTSIGKHPFGYFDSTGVICKEIAWYPPRFPCKMAHRFRNPVPELPPIENE